MASARCADKSRNRLCVIARHLIHSAEKTEKETEGHDVPVPCAQSLHASQVSMVSSPNALLHLGVAGRFEALPIFVCQPSLPASENHFHIFEPRYRLMLRNCLQQIGPAGQAGEFGMCWAVDGESYSEIGTLLRIEQHMTFPDGRSDVRCVGLRRFRVVGRGSVSDIETSTNSEAEYNTATIEWFEDVEEESQTLSAEVARGGITTRKALADNARSSLARLNDLLLRSYPAPEAKFLLLKIHGPEAFKSMAEKLDNSKSIKVVIDAPDTDSEFAWWTLGQLLPLPADIKAALVESRSVVERLAHAAQLLEGLCEKFEDNVPAEMELVEEAAVE